MSCLLLGINSKLNSKLISIVRGACWNKCYGMHVYQLYTDWLPFAWLLNKLWHKLFFLNYSTAMKRLQILLVCTRIERVSWIGGKTISLTVGGSKYFWSYFQCFSQTLSFQCLPSVPLNIHFNNVKKRPLFNLTFWTLCWPSVCTRGIRPPCHSAFCTNQRVCAG